MSLSRFFIGAFCLVASSLFAGPLETRPLVSAPSQPRMSITSDLGRAGNEINDKGLSLDLIGVYTLQGVVNGGIPVENDVGNLFTGSLDVLFDTEKAGLWKGGLLTLRLEGRAGDNVLVRSGVTSPVDNRALFPLVEGREGSDAWALTVLTFTQYLTEQIGLVGGLMDSTYGDSNPITGNAESHLHFMNMGFLYTPVEASVAPAVALGGGLILKPTEGITGNLTVFGSEETAGTNPFEHYEGTTFSTEWEFEYEMGGRPGGMVVGGLYSVGQPRALISANPLLVLGPEIEEQEAEESTKDSWAVFWNGFQYVVGDEERGMGVFARLGLSDGDPNPIQWHCSTGLGGVGLLPGREKDRWGVGMYYQKFSSDEAFTALGIGEEIGGELFYNIAVTPWMNVSLDAQVVDSALELAGTSVVLGTRVSLRF
jgi:porin